MRRSRHRSPLARPAAPLLGAGLLLLLLPILLAAFPPAGRPALVRIAGAAPEYGPLGPPVRPNLPPIEAPAVAVGAGELHDRGITGDGVTVAVVDSGLAPLGGKWQPQPDGSIRLDHPSGRAGYVVFRDFVDATGSWSVDPHGHGTHVVGTIANRRPLKSSGRGAMGVAPDVNLVVARALGADGSGTYDSMVAAIDWVVASRDAYNIRVLNLSVYAPIQGPYWADPLGLAVMRAWQAGIVVVAAAGNDGPGATTVTVPGNVPYVITVGGARSPQFSGSGGYEVAAFSARGPTESAFAKPDLLVPAVRVVAPMPDNGVLAQYVAAGRLDEKAFLDIGAAKTQRQLGYYQLSGSSMAAAEVSGIAALLLEAEPGLSNDEVKQRLMAASRLALAPGGAAAYSIWEQGAGLLLAPHALALQNTGAANVGMDIAQDLLVEGEQHYWGATTYDELSGEFRMEGPPEAPAGYLAWAGARPAWPEGLSWTGDTETWAGAWRAWAGNSLPTGEAPASGELGNEDYGVHLPMLFGGP